MYIINNQETGLLIHSEIINNRWQWHVFCLTMTHLLFDNDISFHISSRSKCPWSDFGMNCIIAAHGTGSLEWEVCYGWTVLESGEYSSIRHEDWRHNNSQLRGGERVLRETSHQEVCPLSLFQSINGIINSQSNRTYSDATFV